MRTIAVFVYGSLLVAPLVRALLRRQPVSQVARADGYRRTTLRGKAFPGLVPCAGASTPGALLAVRAGELLVLDDYEQDHYRRRRIVVTLTDGRRAPAQAYLLRASQRPLDARREWSVAAYARRHAAAATREARAWRSGRGLR